ncbi:MAG: MoaD/ThiS family protein [Gemmatimonadales bacterium]
MTADRPIRVLLFARYADLVGREQVELPGEAGLTVTRVVERVRALPGGAGIPRAPLVAVNLRQAEPDTVVEPGDEVAVLPPLAGG